MVDDDIEMISNDPRPAGYQRSHVFSQMSRRTWQNRDVEMVETHALRWPMTLQRKKTLLQDPGQERQMPLGHP